MAVDGGAHVGFWSRELAQHFRTVRAFEPAPDNRECLRRNAPKNVEIHEQALGARAGRIGLTHLGHANSGAPERVPGDDFPVVALDALKLQNVGLIKLDVQGMESDALDGARETLKRWRPVVVVEVVMNDVIDYGPIGRLCEWGATLVARLHADRVFAWKD